MSSTTDEARSKEAFESRLAHGRELLEQMQRILELHEERLRRSTIAARLGLSRVTVWRRMRALDLVDGRRR